MRAANALAASWRVKNNGKAISICLFIKKQIMKYYRCLTCKKLFIPKDLFHLKRNLPKFCSRKCVKTIGQFKKGFGYWTGKKRPPFSVEWKEKIALAKIGNNYGKQLRGIKRSEETKNKIALAKIGNNYNLGRKHSQEFKNKCRNSKLKEKNPNWKNGITPKNQKMRGTTKQRKWREAVFKRDNWICQKCGIRNEKGKNVYLNAHHIKSWIEYHELRCKINNGITLCQKCHKEIHKKYGK